MGVSPVHQVNGLASVYIGQGHDLVGAVSQGRSPVSPGFVVGKQQGAVRDVPPEAAQDLIAAFRGDVAGPVRLEGEFGADVALDRNSFLDGRGL